MRADQLKVRDERRIGGTLKEIPEVDSPDRQDLDEVLTIEVKTTI